MNIMRNLIIQLTNMTVPAALVAGMIILAGCDQSEVERITSVGDDNNVSGKLATLSISLQGIPEYNAPDGQTRSSGSNEPLIAEWVAVNTFDATRPIEKSGDAATDEESEGPRIALMELREDTVPARPVTRGVMDPGVNFRLIAFRKTGENNYVFQSVADYTSSGSSSPVLKEGTMSLPIGGTYRFVAYSFNNNASMGPLPLNYEWGVTPIQIPDLSYDFLTYASTDITPQGVSLALTVNFTHQLSQLTVRISPTASESVTNITGVCIRQGGNSSSWTVGQEFIAANTSDSDQFNIDDNSDATVRLVPFSNNRPISVHFGTMTVGGISASNIDITSSRPIQLVRGRRYIMNVQVRKGPGIMVSASEINLNGIGTCTQQDKEDLAKIRWAEGNLMSVSDGSQYDYVWGGPTEYGYYYTPMSTYTGDNSRNGVDPCGRLNPSIYGKGWRTPRANELEKLGRCSSGALELYNGVNGIWFMNNPSGIFLPAAGCRTFGTGCGTSPNHEAETSLTYWSSDPAPTGPAYLKMLFVAGSSLIPSISGAGLLYGLSVRCVKGEPQ